MKMGHGQKTLRKSLKRDIPDINFNGDFNGALSFGLPDEHAHRVVQVCGPMALVLLVVLKQIVSLPVSGGKKAGPIRERGRNISSIFVSFL